MTPYMPYARASRRRPHLPVFVPVFVLFACLGVLLVTVPLSGVHIPGSRHMQALLDRVPQPWKPARPVYVAAPDVAPDAAPAIGAAEPAAASARGAAAAPPAPAVAAAAPPAPALAAPLAAAPAPQPVISAPPAAPALAAPPASFKLDGFRHQWQTWNNCGPATITMALSHFGRTETQVQAAPFLKPNPDDKNVSPDELVAYVRSVGMGADLRVAGDVNRLKQLIANDVPVVVEMWFTPHPNDGMGHYRLLVAYDDAAGRFLAYDSYDPPGQNVPLPYKSFDADWRVFDRTYIPVYPPEKAGLVAAILGTDRDDGAMWQRSLTVAQAEIAAQPNDAYSWFNLGTTLTAMGRTAEAVSAYDKARALKLPWRMLWYQFGPFEAYLTEGRLNDVLTLTGANLQQTGDLEESLYYRGRALALQGQIPAARSSFQAAIRANSRYMPAYDALGRLG